MKKTTPVKQKKTKTFTIRITEELAEKIKSANEKCRQHNIAINFTDSLTKAIEKDLLIVQKHIQKEVDENWKLGQKSLDL